MNIETDERSYVILLKPEPESSYTVTSRALPGIVTCGESLDETRVKAGDAIKGYRHCLREDGEPIPDSDVDTALVERVTVTTDTCGAAGWQRLRLGTC